MSKSAKEWFKHLPEPYRTQAIENSRRLDAEHESLADALLNQFWWKDTPEGQGYNYWDSIHQRAINGEFDLNLHGWIPVKERLPEMPSENYLVVKNGVVGISLFRGDWNNFQCDLEDFQCVTHWQPLPKLPETI